MAKILVVKPLFPYPPSQGTRRVSLDLLADLATRHEVLFLCQLDNRAERSMIEKIDQLGVKVIAPLMPNHTSFPHKVFYKLKYICQSKLSGIPRLCLYWSNNALRSNLARICRDWQPDLTILENWETWQLHRSISVGRTTLLAHDVAYQLIARSVDAATDPGEKARRKSKLIQYRRLEQSAWSLFDGILTLTENDREIIEAELTAQGHSKPLVRLLQVPVSEELFNSTRSTDPGVRVGFLGTFKADFNRDALSYILTDIWPETIRQIPGARLRIAGNGYTGPLQETAKQAGAEWLGFVPDLGDYFSSIDVLLVPLRFGAGVRIRIIEALAAGVPVVATPISVAGLGINNNHHYLEGTTAQEIADQITWALTNPAAAAKIGLAGREWCRTNHGAATLRPLRIAAVENMID